MTDDRPPLRRATLARAAALLLASALASIAHAADAPKGIGPEAFFQHPRMTEASISPDGQTVVLAMARSATDRVHLVALDLNTMKFTALAGYEDADVASFHWVNDHRVVFDLTDRQVAVGKLDAASGLFAVNTDGKQLRQLVSQYGKAFFEDGTVHTRVLPWNNYFLGAIGDRTGSSVYVYKAEEIDYKHADYLRLEKLDTVTGLVSEIETPPHTFGWLFDPKGELRVVRTDKANHAKLLARSADGQQWDTLAEFDNYSDDPSFHPAYIDQDGTMYVQARKDGDKVAVWTYDLAHHKLSDKPWLVSQNYDLWPAYTTVNGKLAGLSYLADAEVTQWIVPEMEALQAKVDKKLPVTVNELHVASRGDGKFVVVHAFSDRVPGLFFLYDVQKDKLITLGNAQPDIDPKTQARMEQVHYKARDGLDIPGWLTVPHGAERKNLPLVVLVHGGPNVRGRSWDWNPEVQFLAAHGYAVLEPEFRGSTGYGEKLFTAGWKQWGLAMQDDVADGVKWAVAQGIADPKRVCIAGASYGGYAVLEGLARDPELYRCGFEWVGVTDIQLMYSADWSDMSDAWKQYGMPKLIGDRVADAAQLKATSPVNHVEKIHAPLLMAYGGKDVRVPIQHGEHFHDALMKQPGAKVEWVVYDDEGHGWRTVETNIDFWNRVAKFLDANIGH